MRDASWIRSRVEAWNLIVTLNWDLGDHDGAIADCAEAAERFPGLHPSWTGSQAAEQRLAEEERVRAERARQETEVKGWLAQARRALENGQDADAIAFGQQILALRPNHVDALANTAFAQQRSGQIDEALELLQGSGAVAAEQQDLVAVGPEPATAWDHSGPPGDTVRSRRRAGGCRASVGHARAPGRRPAATLLVVELRGRVPPGALAKAASSAWPCC